MAARRAPAPQIAWLTEWARRAVQPPQPDFPDISLVEQLAQIHAPALNQLISDDTVRHRLAQAEASLAKISDQASARQAICDFLVAACWICDWHTRGDNAPNSVTAATPGEVIRDLKAFATATEKLVARLRQLQHYFAPANSVNYLAQRHAANNATGFIVRRKGWLKQIVERQQDATVDQYLTCLAKDIREEASLRQIRVEAQRQHGGGLADLHAVVDMITESAARLSATTPQKPDAQLIAAAINTLLHPNRPLDAGTVRKRYAAR